MSIVYLSIAAMLNAVMDVLSHHFPRSIFAKRKNKWWNPKKSWKNKYVNWDSGNKKEKLFYVFSDAWYTFKNISMVMVLLALVNFKEGILPLYINFLLCLLVYVVVYNAFYHKILRKNEKKK